MTMKSYLHIYYVFKAILFRIIVFFPFEFFGYLNLFSLFYQGKNLKKRIAFQAYNPQVAQVFSPIIRELQKNNLLDIYFIVMFHPYHSFKGLRDTKRFAHQELKIDKSRILNVWEAYWKSFNCLICADVYAKFPLLKTNKIIIPHGAGLLSRWVNKNIFRKMVSDFDFYFVCGEFDILQIKDFVDKKTELHITGFPFVDALTENSHVNDDDTIKCIENDTDGKRVLFAPSWGHTYQYGDNLERKFEEVMTCLIKKDMTILLKPHAASFIKGQVKGISWKKKLNKYREYDNVKIIDCLNDVPYFQLADVLITDTSSRSFNFMITDKPVIVYGVPDKFSSTTVEKIRIDKIVQGAYTADTPEELSKVLDRCLQHPDEMSENRQNIVKDVYAHLGNAAYKTAETIIEIVEKR